MKRLLLKFRHHINKQKILIVSYDNDIVAYYKDKQYLIMIKRGVMQLKCI